MVKYLNDIYHDKKYDEWIANNKEEIKKHINNQHQIYLWGLYGTGKTHFLCWLSKLYYNMGASVYINKFSDIITLYRKEIDDRKNGIYNKSIESKMKECTVLCIDDLGNENMTPYTYDLLINVIDYRYITHKATFITSNYKLIDLFKVYNEAVGEVKAGQLVTRLKTFGEIKIDSKNFRNEGL